MSVGETRRQGLALCEEIGNVTTIRHRVSVFPWPPRQRNNEEVNGACDRLTAPEDHFVRALRTGPEEPKRRSKGFNAITGATYLARQRPTYRVVVVHHENRGRRLVHGSRREEVRPAEAPMGKVK